MAKQQGHTRLTTKTPNEAQETKMYITNNIKVNGNTKRIVLKEDNCTVYTAEQSDYSCWVVWAEFNADPIFMGWFDTDGSIELNDGNDLDYDDVSFSESDVVKDIKEIIEQISLYEKSEGDLFNFNFYNEETGTDCEMYFKLTQQAYITPSTYNVEDWDNYEWAAHAIAENGKEAVLYWYIDKNIDEPDAGDFGDDAKVIFL